jgi:hypothetical protein
MHARNTFEVRSVSKKLPLPLPAVVVVSVQDRVLIDCILECRPMPGGCDLVEDLFADTSGTLKLLLTKPLATPAERQAVLKFRARMAEQHPVKPLKSNWIELHQGVWNCNELAYTSPVEVCVG